MTNQELIEKINKAVTGTADGGLLSAQQTQEFLDLVVDQTPILQEMRVETGIEKALDVDGIEFGETAIIAGVEGTAPADGDVVKPSLPRVTLTPKEIVVAIDLSYSWLRSNIMRNNAENAVDAAIAKRIGMDLLDLAFNGDTTLDTSTRRNKGLRILDGIIKRALADSTVIDHVIAANPTFGGAGGELSEGLSLLPKQYRDDRSALMHLISVSNMDKYEDEIASRQTSAADNVLFGTQAVTMHKRVKLVAPYMFPDDKLITTVKRNIVLGFGRQMQFYKENNHRARKVEITIVTDFDVNYLFGGAVVLGSKA